MKDFFIYIHDFKDYSIELTLEINVYRPRHPSSDDVPEIDILNAIVNEDIGDYKMGQSFDVDLLNYDKVAEKYFNQD